MGLVGCLLTEKIHLKEPIQNSPRQFNEILKKGMPNESTIGPVKDMLGRIEIRYPARIPFQGVSTILQDGLSFLVREFGPPVYKGNVVLVITDDPADNANITWKESDDLERQIALNHYNVMKPMWHHYLVHELFHAFYQSSNFLRMNPDSIIEGLAIYAQYKYQNRKMSTDKIREKIYSDAASLRLYSSSKGIDFDRPFYSYGEGERKYVYLVSGLIFFNQDPETIKEKIKNMLWSASISDEKMSFNKISTFYGFKTDDKMFQRSEKNILALPEPKEAKLDLQKNKKESGID